MGCIVVKACDPSLPEGGVRELFWHVGGVLVDSIPGGVGGQDPPSSEEGEKEPVQHYPPGILYVYNSKLIYQPRHCTLSRNKRVLQFEICDIQEVNSFNKFTSRKDGRTFARSVIDISVAPNAASSAAPQHVGFITKEADKIAQLLYEVCQKHKQKPKIFQFNSIDVEGVEIEVP